MATVVSREEADARFGDLYARAMSGEEIVITDDGTPTMLLVPVGPKSDRRKPGRFRGQFTVPDSFFDPMTDEELKDWGY